MSYKLPPETKLRLIATHKQNFTTFEKIITFAEWIKIKKNFNYYYLTYQID